MATTTRRRFLRETVGRGFSPPWVGACFAPPLAAPASGALLSVACTAMACRFEIMLPAGDARHLPAAQAALAQAGDLERQLSVFRDDSEVSDINRRAAREPVRVEARLFGLLQAAAALARATGGAFDITAGPRRRSCADAGPLPDEREVAAALPRVGMDHVRLSEHSHTIAFDREGVAINLGAIGKGYALDRMAERLREAGVENALLHAGYSSIAALGRPPWDEGWVVNLRREGAGPATVLRLRDCNLATSGAGRLVEIRGRRGGHIVDPRTGRPAPPLASATAIAATAAEADALSTAFYVMGVERAGAYCERHPGTAAIIVGQGGERHVMGIEGCGGKVEVSG